MTFGEMMRELMAEGGMSLRKLAGSVPADLGYLSKVPRDLKLPSAVMAERIDTALGGGGRLVAVRQSASTSPTPRGTLRNSAILAAGSGAVPDVLDFAAWIESANVGGGTLDFFDQETRRLAFDYARRPPTDVVTEAAGLLAQVTGLLRSGRQRIAQSRALFRTSAELYGLLCLLAGDLGRYPAARAYGHAAWLCAEEADSDLHRALVLSAQSKTAKWEQRYREAADLARCGYEHSPRIEARILLASQEANALQALGDVASAEEALTLAKRARDELTSGEDLGAAWACPRPRQATYALQVALGAGDHEWMLREVGTADEAWSEGDLWVYGTWSQIRIGAGIAHALAGEVDGVAEEIAPVLDLPPELRVVTITGRLGVVEQQLAQHRYVGSGAAVDLRDQIRDFRAGALRQGAVVHAEDR